MNDIQTTFNERKCEINDFIELLKFLEMKENNTDDDGVSEFSKFFRAGDDKVNISFQRMINIMKSNLSLMIYNIIEFTISNLMDSIYEEIRVHNLSYLDVNDSIKKLWRKTILKAANDPNATMSTFMKKNEEIIDKILHRSVINLQSRNTLPAGNLDGPNIKETLEKHGINMQCTNYRPLILANIKSQRNDLAHGSVSFVEALRDSTIGNIKNDANIIIAFLEELLLLVEEYIKNEAYKCS